ncbi:hypothetical protein GXM_01418 [Nostoc sphaeroides CCNUC1]|uniref:Uncharacterized protein n=1 Tax=Nostoc sphaeroides CCNUC1 TaxID=2653204 RepID=A0A5P8VU28_9NOSO|nr:hypothetical protein GXM_01418 [Nostoc sphaeroides CCNUC1]
MKPLPGLNYTFIQQALINSEAEIIEGIRLDSSTVCVFVVLVDKKNGR